MDYSFTAEQLAIRETIREVAQDKVVARVAENGILGIPFPEEYGGVSGSSVSICMGVEEIAKGDATCSLLLAVQALGSYPILLAGREEQKKRLCPPLAAGDQM